MKPKISNLMEGTNSSLRKTYEEAVGCPMKGRMAQCPVGKCIHQSTHPTSKSMQNEEKVDQESEGSISERIEKAYSEAYCLARKFHELYEETAPKFGYPTRDDTKKFDPASPNGRLMAYVCKNIVDEEVEQALLTQRERMCEKLAGMKQEKPKGKCINLENHLLGSCFDCKKIDGFNQGIDVAIDVVQKEQ